MQNNLSIKDMFIEFLTNHPGMRKEKQGPKNLYANLLDEGSALDINIKSLKIPYFTSGYTCTDPQYWEYVIKPLYVAKFHKDKGTHPMVAGTYWNHLATINKYIEFLLKYDKPVQDNTIPVSIQIQRDLDEPLQQIYFGAPGTGKSHRIKQVCRNYEHYRITFHPDTDYASFVGSYKPITHSEQIYTNMGDKAIALKDSVTGEPVTTTKITYQYVYQAFLNAYIAAWKQQQNENPQPVFLIIEEINRGNCAQIFGDIFQLLDRNESGFSDYPIIADNDLKKELAKEFENLDIANYDARNSIYGDDIIAKVKSGSHLLLPNNLYIWATMNTSDQSLFPIDSAFKRRWDWKYVKIADSGKNYRISVNNNEYDWWEFINAINDHIGTNTDQEDKKLGYFFAKAKKDANGKYLISADTFLSKVIFFIYNDVYKDFGFDDDIFKDENGEELTFANYFNQYGDTVPEKVERFIRNLGLLPLQLTEAEEEARDELENEFDNIDDGSTNKLTVRFPDGTIIRENTRFESYLKALEKIGLDRVEPIAAEKKYVRRDSALISKSESTEVLADPVYSYVKRGEYYIIKGTNTKTQKNLLNLVSDRLNLGLIVTVE